MPELFSPNSLDSTSRTAPMSCKPSTISLDGKLILAFSLFALFANELTASL